MNPGAVSDGDEGRLDVTIEESRDLAPLQALAIASGLDESGLPEGLEVTAWAARTAAGELVGTILLEYGPGLTVIHWLAVAEPYRGRKIATRLLESLEEEARRRRVSLLWTTARAPGFFLANGYDEAPDGPEARRLLGDCLSCRQYRHGCEPKAMVKALQRTGAHGRPSRPGEG
jgi:N-acetylglutamate synthase-like GNAT family acetyltransferase